MASYCAYARSLPKTNLHRIFHDLEHGYPCKTDDQLFERLMLEINQAGLSWDVILKKRESLQQGYANFNINTVALFDESDFLRLKNDTGVIRNKLKINAAIHNAQVIKALQKEHGSWMNWLLHLHPLDKNAWIKQFKRTFKFTGGEIVNEFLMGTGFLAGAHDEDCPVYNRIKALKPAWILD